MYLLERQAEKVYMATTIIRDEGVTIKQPDERVDQLAVNDLTEMYIQSLPPEKRAEVRKSLKVEAERTHPVQQWKK